MAMRSAAEDEYDCFGDWGSGRLGIREIEAIGAIEAALRAPEVQRSLAVRQHRLGLPITSTEADCEARELQLENCLALAGPTATTKQLEDVAVASAVPLLLAAAQSLTVSHSR
jgi:hypothetical protein